MRTLNSADTESWKFAENEGRKVADTSFLRVGNLPTLFSRGWKLADTFF